MAYPKPITLTARRAQALLRQLTLAVSTLTAGILGGIALGVFHEESIMLGIVVAVVAGVFFYICLWRLAYGMGRSVIYWCGGTLLLTGVLPIVAQWIAWGQMRQLILASGPSFVGDVGSLDTAVASRSDEQQLASAAENASAMSTSEGVFAMTTNRAILVGAATITLGLLVHGYLTRTHRYSVLTWRQQGSDGALRIDLQTEDIMFCHKYENPVNGTTFECSDQKH